MVKSRSFRFAFNLLILIGSSLWGQYKYPADSLLFTPNTSLILKTGIVPIAAWQRVSYNTNLIRCQFYPSCSSYGAQAIKEKGLFMGSVLAADRIIRCNPLAFHYHLERKGKFRQPDGRLLDPVIPLQTEYNSKSPLRAAFLSALLPGAGRAYAGRWHEGFLGFMMVSLFATTAYQSFQVKDSLKTPIFMGITLVLYGGEIYGAYRTTKYY